MMEDNLEDNFPDPAVKEAVEEALGDSVICDVCQATLETYADRCTADLGDVCPGFDTVDKEEQEQRRLSRHNP